MTELDGKLSDIPSNLSTTHGHLGDRRKWVLWRGGHYRDVGVSYENSF